MKIKLYTGCMGAGKTSSLITEYQKNLANSYMFSLGKVQENSLLISRDGKTAICIAIKKLHEVIEYLYHYNLCENKCRIFVDEIQFAKVKELEILIYLAHTYQFDLIFSGLNLDYMKEKWAIYRKIETLEKQYMSEIVTLSCKCVKCDNKALYSKRLFESGKLIADGEYIAVCRECYND